jgi:uncharacterized protein YgfB (UPF0149 family)
MSFLDLQIARRQCQEMRDLIVHRGGGWRDERLLQKLQELSRAATSAVEDREFRERLGTVEDYASALFSDDRHQEWARQQMSGVDYLRQYILAEMGALLERLRAIEAGREKAMQRAAQLRTGNPRPA